MTLREKFLLVAFAAAVIWATVVTGVRVQRVEKTLSERIDAVEWIPVSVGEACLPIGAVCSVQLIKTTEAVIQLRKHMRETMSNVQSHEASINGAYKDRLAIRAHLAAQDRAIAASKRGWVATN